MNPHQQVLFFFSALGAFNGLCLSTYFAFIFKHRSKAIYFLAAFLLVVSVRIIKSVFLHFYPHIPQLFVQVGLSAWALIGPFLYLYLRTAVTQKPPQRYGWLWHTLPGLLFVNIYMHIFPYWESRRLYCGIFMYVLYGQWGCYVAVAGYMIRDAFKKLFTQPKKLMDEEIWQLSLVMGIFIIWAAYSFSHYTSYISGAVSFSFIFYLLAFVWIVKKRKNVTFFESPVRYANKNIGEAEAVALSSRLEALFTAEALYKDPGLKLTDVALAVPPHYLSQYVNDNLGQHFNHFVNTYRIMAAEQMLAEDHHLTLEAIGQACGFRSNSSFYAAFKKVKGVTPAQYKKARR